MSGTGAGNLRIKQEFFQRLRGFTPISGHGASRVGRAMAENCAFRQSK
jgi:hypothetical protein